MKITAKTIKYAILPTLIVLLVGGIIDAYFFEYIIGKNRPISLAQWVSGCGAIIGLWLFFRRTENQEKQLQYQGEQLQNQNKQLEQQREQIDIQINKEIDDRFNASVQLLGNSETSARIGGMYSLHKLIIGDAGKEYRVQVVQILCSHIRSKTQEQEYQELHTDRPSHEIQIAIDILFRNVNGVKGIYQQDFSQENNFPRADLSHAHLQGANFNRTQCQGTNFSHADCQRADFTEAKCQRASFMEAQCLETIFREAHCHEADFTKAQCQKVNFREVQCLGTIFREAYLQDADFTKAKCLETKFEKAHLQGTKFTEARCQSASFRHAQCQGTDFIESQCQGSYFLRVEFQGADFYRANCQGANFTEAQCQGARFNKAKFQGAYAIKFNGLAHMVLELENRINQDTELETLRLEGALGEVFNDTIETAKQYLPDYWYTKMQEIIKEHENKEPCYAIPEGIIEGKLETSEVLAIIKEQETIQNMRIKYYEELNNNLIRPPLTEIYK